MRKIDNLWGEITSFKNLLLAAGKAQKGKRFNEPAARFNLNLEKELFKLQDELCSGFYMPGEYKEFVIYEPVKRLISAAPYRDRVVHHALCNVIEPIFERSFIYDSYANRKGKGTHKALDRFKKYMKSHKYVLKCDISKYFHSIDHEILIQIVSRKIEDENTLQLIKLIIGRAGNQEDVYEYFDGDSLLTPFDRRRGLPIGNLTSQFFANVYLDGMDHYVKEVLRRKAYLRYVDDFAIFGEDKKELHSIKNELSCYIKNLRLKLHPVKTRVLPTEAGCGFLGFLHYPRNTRILKANVSRFKKRMTGKMEEYSKGVIGLEKCKESLVSWCAHASNANSIMLRKNIFGEIKFRKGIYTPLGRGQAKQNVSFAVVPGTMNQTMYARPTATGTRQTTGTTT